MGYRCHSIDTIDLKPEDIKQIVSIGEIFCKNMGNADVTLTFAVSAKGEIAIVESSLQAGVEVTFHCAEHK